MTSAPGILCCPMGSEINGSWVISLHDKPHFQSMTSCETLVVESFLHAPAMATSMNPTQLH